MSVVIPTRDRPDLLEQAIAGVLADPATAEVIVMVDPSTGLPTRELLERLATAEPRLRWSITPSPPDGRSRVQHARDVGVQMAKSEVVLSLDDDVVPEPGMVSGHAADHAKASGRVVVGYMPVVSEEPWPRSNAPIHHYSGAYERYCELYRSDPDSILPNLWGGNVSVRRDDWLAAVEGPRTEAWGHDDQELGVLFLRQGLRGRFDESLRGAHHYKRDLRSFVARAESSSLAQAKLRMAHPDLLGETAREGQSWKRRLFSPALALSRSRAGWFVVRWTMIGVISLAAAVRMERLENAAARYLFHIAGQRSLRRAGVERG